MSEEIAYADVYMDTKPYPTITYRTALTVYEESLINGQYVGRGWNGAGYINSINIPSTRLDPTKYATPQAFWVEVDGQFLGSYWKWSGLEKAQEKHGLHVTVDLKHTVRPVTVRVHTLLDGTSILTRWLEIANTGDCHAALSAAMSWSGVLQSTKRWRMHLPEKYPLYSLGYMEDTHWGDEGNFQWHPLPNAGYRVDGRYRRDRHRHPMFMLRNNATGEHFIGQLAWSGGYVFEFDLDADLDTTDMATHLSFRVGPDAPAPLRVVAPGETVRTPEMHLGMVFGDLDTAVQAMHDHLRRSVFMPQARGRGGWVESAIGPEQKITMEAVYHAIDHAADIGAEVFFIDAGWYAPPSDVDYEPEWWPTAGDWIVNRERFPDGLKPIRDCVHEKGMLFGLWMDAERIGPKSHIAQEHSDWLAVAYDGQKKLSCMLDLTQPTVARWMEDQIRRVIEENELEFFRLDYNVGHLGPGACTTRNGLVENSYWRYYENLYAIYDRLRARFPNVIFENCAGGGGRTDIGMVRRFSHTWVTDWQIAPRSFTITNGMTIALPPEYVDRLIAGQNGHTTADIDFQTRLLLFVRPTIGTTCPLGAGLNPILVARIRHMVDIYKNFVRRFMSEGRIYHHTPTFDGPEPKGWGVLELAAHDRSRGIAGVFQLSAPRKSEYMLRLRGLDVSRRYRVTWDNRGQVCEVDGFTLMEQGILVRLEGALTSELLLFDSV